MPVYLGLGVFVQLFGSYLQHHNRHNVLLYNSFSVAEFIFYFYFLRSNISSVVAKKILFIIIILYASLALMNIAFFQKDTFHSISYMLGCVVIVVYCIIYFVELFQLGKTTNLLIDPVFWIVTSVLFSYTCTFPLWSMINLLSNLSAGLRSKLFFYIQTSINILSYLLFIIAFLCRIRIRKSFS